MKYLLTTILVFALYSLSSAQLSVNAGGIVALPMGNFGNASSLGVGVSVNADFSLPAVTATGSTGFHYFMGKNSNGYSATIIPILVGAKYSVVPNVYVLAQTGLNLISQTVKIPEVKVGTIVISPEREVSSSDSEFGFALGGGVGFGMLDLSVKYMIYASNFNSLNIGVSYKLF